MMYSKISSLGATGRSVGRSSVPNDLTENKCQQNNIELVNHIYKTNNFGPINYNYFYLYRAGLSKPKVGLSYTLFRLRQNVGHKCCRWLFDLLLNVPWQTAEVVLESSVNELS